MKVCIFGAGAIGGFLAHGLAGVDGVDLSIVARGPHLEAMRDKGLTLVRDGAETTVAVTASADPADLGPQDYVIVALKAHQAWESADQLVPLLKADTAVVTCQNGVPWWYFHKLEGPYEGHRLSSIDAEDRQWNLIGPERAIGCVVYPATEITAPGVIRHVYGDKFTLGEPDGHNLRAGAAPGAAIAAGGLKAPVVA